MGRGSCPPQEDFGQKCRQCSKFFSNKACFEAHQGGPCDNFKLCVICGHCYRTKKTHICGETYCNLCHRFHNDKKGCYIQPIKFKNKNPSRRIIVFDLEVT